MKWNKILVYMGMLSLCGWTQSCSKNESELDYNSGFYQVRGQVEKGPFVKGSEIRLNPMDPKMKTIGQSYSTLITDNKGSFQFNNQELESSYAQLVATGYYFNEVEGNLSRGNITLRALTDLSDNSTVNVNLLTHLKYQRIITLVNSGLSFSKANSQAQKELLGEFGLGRYANKDVAHFSIASGTEEASALLAISALLLINRSDAELTEYLMTLSEDFGVNGSFSADNKKQIRKDRFDLKHQIGYIRESVIDRYQELGIDIEVDDLIYYFDWNDDGIAGNEIAREGTNIKLDVSQLLVPNEGGKYTVKIHSNIPLSLTEPRIEDDDDDYPIDSSTIEQLSLYDISEATPAKIELVGNELQLTIYPNDSRQTQEKKVYLYDFMGEVVASLQIEQKGNPNAPLPTLSKKGELVFMNTMTRLSQTNVAIERIGEIYSEGTPSILQYITASSSIVSDAFKKTFYFIHTLLKVKDLDANSCAIIQEELSIPFAISYYQAVVLWNNIPYITSSPNNYAGFSIPQESKENILASLIEQMKVAIDVLDEHKNYETPNLSSYLYVSKDVPRLLLAQIHMYQGDFELATPLLQDIVNTNFYQLSGRLSDTATDEHIYVVPTEKGEMEPYFTYTDVLLSLAECHIHAGRNAEAEKLIQKVAETKHTKVTPGENLLTTIQQIRALMGKDKLAYFAFLKRNKLAQEVLDIEDWQLLLPIPIQELYTNPNITQNPGY